MGFEDEAERSIGRPCRQTNGRSKRPCELTSSIVPRGTSSHHAVELEYSPIGVRSKLMELLGRLVDLNNEASRVPRRLAG